LPGGGLPAGHGPGTTATSAARRFSKRQKSNGLERKIAADADFVNISTWPVEYIRIN
jgi:hypothetical protein